MSAWWGSSPLRGGGRRTPGESGLDIHQSAQVKETFAEMGGKPNEIAVHGIHRVVHSKSGLAGQIADAILIHEAVFGGHGDSLAEAGILRQGHR